MMSLEKKDYETRDQKAYRRLDVDSSSSSSSSSSSRTYEDLQRKTLEAECRAADAAVERSRFERDIAFHKREERIAQKRQEELQKEREAQRIKIERERNEFLVWEREKERERDTLRDEAWIAGCPPSSPCSASDGLREYIYEQRRRRDETREKKDRKDRKEDVEKKKDRKDRKEDVEKKKDRRDRKEDVERKKDRKGRKESVGGRKGRDERDAWASDRSRSPRRVKLTPRSDGLAKALERAKEAPKAVKLRPPKVSMDRDRYRHEDYEKKASRMLYQEIDADEKSVPSVDMRYTWDARHQVDVRRTRTGMMSREKKDYEAKNQKAYRHLDEVKVKIEYGAKSEVLAVSEKSKVVVEASVYNTENELNIEIDLLANLVRACQVGEVLIRRCLAIKRNGSRCQHTSTTSSLSDEGLCRGAHRDWLDRGRPMVPKNELWVAR